MKMYSPTWFMSILALLVMDVRTGALEQEATSQKMDLVEFRWLYANEIDLILTNKKQIFNYVSVINRVKTGSNHRIVRCTLDVEPHRCHQCSATNSTTCDQPHGWLAATCPGTRPYCATVAAAPDFATSLGCAAASGPVCSLTPSPTQTLELTCTCAGPLCNAPFSHLLRNELLNFSSPSGNDSELTEAFFKLSNFANVSESALYKAITVNAMATIMPLRNFSELTTSSTVTAGDLKRYTEVMPRAEALKQQATVPSDDDEDESEGSGAYEDSRSQIQSQSDSVPAAPSSYLPAEGNKAVHIIPGLLLQPLFLLYSI